MINGFKKDLERRTLEYPLGGEDDIDTLFCCLSEKHRLNVSEALQLKARYVIPGATVRDRRYKRIVMFTPQIAEMGSQEMGRFNNWINNEVLISLSPLQGKAYYV